MTDGEPGTERLPEQLGTTQPATSGAGRASTDLIQTVTRLDRALKERRDTDVQLVKWWLYFLLLSWITLGIYVLYVYFKRMSRIDGFSHRKRAYYESLLEWTSREPTAKGKEDAVHHDLDHLGDEVTRAYSGDFRPISPPVSFILTLVTIGICGFVVLYRLNRYWWDAQLVEQDFDDKLSQIWMRLGIARYPLTFQVDQSKRRDYAFYLILSFVTLGIWAMVWDYKIYTDLDNLVGEYHSIEDSVLHTVRSQ
jgi:Domain of unknown function (DUF4234)